MLVHLQTRLIPALSLLQVPFTVIKGHKDIQDVVEVEIEAETCLRKVEEQKDCLVSISFLLQKSIA